MDRRLYKAATSGSVDLIKELKRENPNLLLGVTPILENTVLHLAAKAGREDLVKEVYEECQSLLAIRNSKGDTALHFAARAGYLSIVNFLVEKSISGSTSINVQGGGNQTSNILRIQNEGKNTVLHEALRYRRSEVAKVLTEKAPHELWCVVNEAGESPLYLAAKGGLTEIVRQVLQSSQPYDHGGPNGLTALHAAAIWNNSGIAELLVEKKQELIKEKDIYDRTALHYAASYDCCAVAVLLLESDTSVAYIQDKDGKSPLHFAAGKGNSSITKEIIGRYPDAVDLVDNRGQNAFHVCIGKCLSPWIRPYEEVVSCLMSEVRDDELLINQQDNDGNTPLHLAVKSGIPRLVTAMLWKKGRVDTDTMNKDNLTPFDLTLPIKEVSREEIDVYWKLREIDAKFGIADPLNTKGLDLSHTPDEDEEYFINKRKEINSTQMIVATLIATVTFAAAFQVPGGYKSGGEGEGTATLATESAFQAFVLTDAIALTCSMTAVFLSFIFIIFHNYGSSDYLSPRFLLFVTSLILMAMIAMLVAFVAGLYVVLSTVSLWLAIVACFIVFGIYLFGFFFLRSLTEKIKMLYDRI